MNVMPIRPLQVFSVFRFAYLLGFALILKKKKTLKSTRLGFARNFAFFYGLIPPKLNESSFIFHYSRPLTVFLPFFFIFTYLPTRFLAVTSKRNTEKTCNGLNFYTVRGFIRRGGGIQAQ